jgi:hypothetical protein
MVCTARLQDPSVYFNMWNFTLLYSTLYDMIGWSYVTFVVYIGMRVQWWQCDGERQHWSPREGQAHKGKAVDLDFLIINGYILCLWQLHYTILVLKSDMCKTELVPNLWQPNHSISRECICILHFMLLTVL